MEQQQQQQLEILDNDDVAEHDHLFVDIQEIWEILGEKCPEDILAGKVQEGLPELEMATSKGKGDILDFENGASHISSESISENPFVYNHQNQESSAQGISPSSVSLSDWMLADSDPNAVTNPLIHDFPTHGIDYHDESRHDIPNLVPRFGLTPEDRPEDVPMKKLNVNRSDHFDSSKYITRISDKSESGELSPMDMDTPITWEPFGSYDPFIHNNIDMSIPNDSLPDLSSQPIVQHNNIKYEDNNYASSNKQNPNKLNIRLKPISPFLPCTSADMYENNLVSLKKQSGKNLVSKGLNYSSYYGTHKKSPAGNDLSKMFPPRISWNLSKNISGHVKSEYEDSKRALENISGHVKDEEEDWFSKRDREDISGHVKDEKEDWLSERARVNISGHVKDEKEDWFSKRACENISGHVKDEKEDCFSKRARETDNGKVLSQKKDLMKRARQNYCAGISANKNLNSAVGDHITDSKALNPLHPQSFTSTNRFYCEKEESVTAHSTAFVISFQVDNDDVCIIEGPGAPVLSNSLYINRNPISNSRMLPVIDPLKHVGMGGVKVKANDERQVLRVALQDLSQSKTEARLPDGIMAVPLLKHQRIALSWMIKKETGLHCSGGFLADDQGLGKTISTIALIVKEKPPTSSIRAENKKPIKTETLNLDEDVDYAESCPEPSNRNSKGRPSGGTLVVCPTSVLRQWAEEIRDKITQRERLSVLIYHGSNRTKDPSELEKYDVVLTTYSIVGVEVPKQPLVDKDEISKKRKSEFPSTSKKSRKKVREKEKDLFVGPLAKVGWFRVVLDEAQSIKNYKTQVARACWGLRAKRRWCLSGTPIQNSIDDLYSYFRFLRYEPYATYKSFVSSIRIPINRNRTTGYKKLQAVLKTVMLRRTKGTILDGEPIINLPPKTVELKKVEFTKEERDFYCQLESDSQAQFEEYAAAGTVKQNYVNILLLLLRLRQACDHPLLVRRNDSSSEWKSSVEMAKKLPREKQVALLSCLEASLAICGLCNDPPEDAVVTTCEHVFCYQCIYQYMGDDNQCPDTNCKNKLSAKLVFSTAALKYCLSDNFSEVFDKLEPSAWDLPFESSKIKAVLEVLNSFCNPKPVIDDVPSPPKMSLDPFEIKEEVSDDDTDEDSKQSVKVNREKAIVFSQWTRMLDLLEPGLKSSNIQYRRLDGTMSVLDRDKAVKEFKTLPEVTVMIMSLKAASLGLNMVAACRVILLDLWWNPTTEDQAVDRAHRIGQTRPVSVLRLTVKHTVEDRILALQQKKREMVASAFGEDETGSGQTRLTVEDLKYLFRT